MIVDSSAMSAIILHKPDRETFRNSIMMSETAPLMSAANYLETGIIVDGKRNPKTSRQLDALIEELEIELVAVTPAHAHIARQAYRDFGKGSGHPAQLNFGDCFAYALASALNQPLLFKGNDFVHTDIVAA
jgi:ribonuclease VapC